MINSKNGIVPLKYGMKWPGGSYNEIARLAVTEDHLSDYFGSELIKGDEPGLGPWRAIGLQLDSGAVVELISYDADREVGFTLRVDILSDPRIALNEVVMNILTSPQDVTWVSPLIR